MKSADSSNTQENTPNNNKKEDDCTGLLAVVKGLPDKMKKVDLKPSTTTSILARNSILLPTRVARVEQLSGIMKAPLPPCTSASATGKYFNQSEYRVYSINLLFTLSPHGSHNSTQIDKIQGNLNIIYIELFIIMIYFILLHDLRVQLSNNDFVRKLSNLLSLIVGNKCFCIPLLSSM